MATRVSHMATRKDSMKIEDQMGIEGEDCYTCWLECRKAEWEVCLHAAEANDCVEEWCDAFEALRDICEDMLVWRHTCGK